MRNSLFVRDYKQSLNWSRKNYWSINIGDYFSLSFSGYKMCSNWEKGFAEHEYNF